MILLALVFSVLIGGGKCLDLHTFYDYLQDNSTSSNSECEEQKSAFLHSLMNKDAWALKSETFAISFYFTHNRGEISTTTNYLFVYLLSVGRVWSPTAGDNARPYRRSRNVRSMRKSSRRIRNHYD